MRYSLRSLDAHVRHGRVIVIQHRPAWLRNGVEHLPVTHDDPTINRFDRVKNNLRALLEWPDCPDVFAFWNDDFFRMTPLEDYWPESRGFAAEVGRELMAAQPSRYHQSIIDTARLLAERGYPDAMCYEVHAPLVVHADTLRVVFEMFDGVDTLWQWRTAYGNVAGLEPVMVPDPKVDYPDQCKSSWLSTSHRSWKREVGQYVRSTFRAPSRYEAK